MKNNNYLFKNMTMLFFILKIVILNRCRNTGFLFSILLRKFSY